MLRGAWRTACYAKSWKAGADVDAREVEIDRAGDYVPATLFAPRNQVGPVPGWIALGGISCMGRQHPQLVRFARALSSSGAVVLVPDIPEWRRLELAPAAVAPTIQGGIEYLKGRPDTVRAPVGLIGFSFGAPQVAISASRDDLGEDIGGIVLFGGYCSLEKTMTCQLTGEHEWEGLDYRLSPDPFGGWVVGSNHLTRVPGLEDAHEVATALRRLATAASGQRISAWDPRHDGLIRTLRERVPGRHKRLYDLFATPSTGALSEPEERRHVAVRLAETSRGVEPLLDPAPALSEVGLPTALVHGRGDRLIPFTEGLRLHDSLPGAVRRGLTVTAMLHHSADSTPSGLGARARESFKMLQAIRRMINTV
jgi:pimeloyl-ACP methyl ester carboxylesterase